MSSSSGDTLRTDNNNNNDDDDRSLLTSSSVTASVTTYPRFIEHMEPHEVAFQLAKSGKAKQLKQYLNKRSKDERKRIVSSKYNGATSLIMSCKNGFVEIVEYLIEYCAASIEQTGLVNFEGENIEGAPPLWCASAAGHLKIVKYLVGKGANVNSTTKSNSTALRAACFDGHYEIVKYLVENNADIEVANRHGHTCLMIACYKGHYTIAKYLISKNADINRKSVKGNTALHDCAECGSLEILKLLLQNAAKMEPDAYNMTPLLAAAVTGHSLIVEHLLTRHECTSLEKIHALELLGATFVDKKHDMQTAYSHWKKALELRAKESRLDKTFNIEPNEAYEYSIEFRCQKELDEIVADPDDMRMQALLIRERILGPTHPDTTYYIRYRGAVYADCGNFRRCILLWLYALDTQQKCLEPLHPMIQSSFLSFTELFQYMQKQLNPSYDDMRFVEQPNAHMLYMYTGTVHKILCQAVEEIKRGMNAIASLKEAKQSGTAAQPQSQNTSLNDSLSNTSGDLNEPSASSASPPSASHPHHNHHHHHHHHHQHHHHNQQTTFDIVSHFDRTLVVIVHYLIVVSESIKHCSPEDTYKLKKLIYELIKLNPKNSKNLTILHLASNKDSSTIIKNHTLNNFPSLDVLKLLIECGANVNACDTDLNTCLHYAATNRSNSTASAATASAAAIVDAAVNEAEAQGQPPAAGAQGQEVPVSPPASPSSRIISERDKLILFLLNSGAHLDSINGAGKTANDLYKGNGGSKLYQIINPINYLTLQCLAAKAIKKHHIPYKECLNMKLSNFVDIH